MRFSSKIQNLNGPCPRDNAVTKYNDVDYMQQSPIS